MGQEKARHLLGRARVARLATLGAQGRPHLVPCTFVLVDDTVYTAVDAKPKSTTALRRVRNIEENGLASLLVDHYDEDWTALWWVRVDGAARIVTSPDEQQAAAGALVAKYEQYRTVRISGPYIAIDVDRWVSWP